MPDGNNGGATLNERRLVALAVDGETDESCRTFVFKGESHTLGNSLRWALLQNPQVLFCGYSIPHPAEDQMYLRIQTLPEVSAQEALRKGLEDLKAVFESLKSEFAASIARF